MIVVNSIGVEKVMANLPTTYTAAYNTAKVNNFTDSEGSLVGWVKETSDNKGRVSFVSFHNAGHMVSGFFPLLASADMAGASR
jgi:cathepsin A (carboxypeptidase C)